MNPYLSIKDYHCLDSILEAVARIEEYTSIYESAEAFNSDYREFDATLMNFMVIGEMVGKLLMNLKIIILMSNGKKSKGLGTLLHIITLA